MFPRIITKNKDVYDKLLSLKISNEVIFKDDNNTRNILNKIPSINITPINGFLIVKKLNPFKHRVYFYK